MPIRDEQPSDHADVFALTSAAFKQPAEARLVEALRANGDSVISLVAEEDDRVVGHVMLSKLTSPAHALGLAPLSVSPAHQRKRIGAALLTHAIVRAAQDSWQAIFLLGNPAYYVRFGFRVEAAAKFETPYPKEYMMALELAPGALDGMSGAIVYARPFLDLE